MYIYGSLLSVVPMFPSSLTIAAITFTMRLIIPTYLALLLCTHACAVLQTENFFSCVPPAVALYSSNTGAYNELADLNFRNSFAIPVAIARTKNETEVSHVVACARKARLGVCARSGGHSLVGKSLCQGGVMIDVGDMRGVDLIGDGIAEIGAGANLGEVLWGLWNGGRRWFAAGVCPGVGIAGYILGGGHGPYEGSLGIGCDALESVRMVNRRGELIIASSTKNSELFWGLCGAGGGQFGVVTSFKIRTASSKPYDNAVVFRYNWPQEQIGELMEKWMDYGEEGGDVWFRMEMGLATGDAGMFGYGACYNVESVEECEKKLGTADFWNQEGRTTMYASKVTNALDAHAFFGPEGSWGRKRAENLKMAMLEQRYVDQGRANKRTYQSTFMTKGDGDERPTAEFWQEYADFCADPGKRSIPWVVCELNLFNNAIDIPRNNSFPHRGADVITHYIVGGGDEEDRQYAYRWMKAHLAKYTIGVYVNYPELELKDYASKYWGSSLNKLSSLKRTYDPDLFFLNAQPIPSK